MHPGVYTNPKSKRFSGGIDWKTFFEASHLREKRIYNALNEDSAEYVMVTDIAITDISTIWIEFYLLRKDIIFLDIPEFFQKYEKNSLGEFRNTYGYLVKDANEMNNLIQNMLNSSFDKKNPPTIDNELIYKRQRAFLGGLEKRGVKIVTRKLQKLSTKEIKKKGQQFIEDWDLCNICKPLVEASFLDIADNLKKEKGIFSVNVNLASEKAYLEFDPIEISIVRIQKIIEKLDEKYKNVVYLRLVEEMEMKDIKIEPSWREALKEEFEKPYFKELAEFVRGEYLSAKVFPPPRFIFRAFELCPYDAVKVVILGQDPYHGEKQANGLSFAVNERITLPPSLKNIYKEIQSDLGITPLSSGDLTRWAKQGVLLLNSVLTVAAGNPTSHKEKGWEKFTDAVIKSLNENRKHIVYLLWGKYAQTKGEVIDRENNLVLTSAHPSPYSAHLFFSNNHFSKCNKYLKEHGIKPINWS